MHLSRMLATLAIKKVRDLSIINLPSGQSIVVSCDSAGGLGEKPGDTLHVPNYILGRLTTRVALLELVSVGAVPIMVSNTLAVEMNPSGQEIIRGIQDELQELGDSFQIHLTGSTEENFLTQATGIGITALGILPSEHLLVDKIPKECQLLCLGLPKVGAEVLNDPNILTIQHIFKLLTYEEVFEIIPVGSKGILYEASELAHRTNKNLLLKKNCSLDLEKSAGPATCALIAASSNLALDLSELPPLPISVLGSLQEKALL